MNGEKLNTGSRPRVPLTEPPLGHVVNRRTALGIFGSAVVTTLVAGCGGGSGGGTSATADAAKASVLGVGSKLRGTIYENVLADLPRGGSIVLGYGGIVPDSIDSLTNSAYYAKNLSDPVHDWLEHFDENHKLVPSLASELQIVDKLTLRYTLRDGVTFHDGRPVTSKEVKAVFDWVKDPKNASVWADRTKDLTVEAPDPQTVVLRVSKPDAGIRSVLPSIPIVPIDSMKDQAAKPIGCGPFVFKKWVRDSHIQYEANRNYWNSDAPRLDSLRIALSGDQTAGAQTFLAGQVDFYHSVPAAMVGDFQQREDSGELKLLVRQLNWMYIGLNMKAKPFDDVRVRRAMSLAMDRELISRASSNGLGEVIQFPMPASSPYYPKQFEVERDLEQAKQLLVEAGHPDGFSASILTPAGLAQYESMGQLFQASMKDVGIDIKIESVDPATLLERRGSGDFEVLTLGNSADPEPSSLDQFLHTGGLTAVLHGGYSNPKVDELLDKARTLFDDSKRKPLYQEAMRIAVLEDGFPLLCCTTEPAAFAYNPNVNGDQFGPSDPQWYHWPIAARLAA